MKAFHKASSIILFFPVPPAGKGWEYSYPQILQSLPEQLGALLCSGTCPKHWSDWLCKLLGLEELWDVPELPLPLHFLMHASQGGAGMGITGRFSPCFLLCGMGCSGPEVGVCWMSTSTLLSLLIETAGDGIRLRASPAHCSSCRREHGVNKASSGTGQSSFTALRNLNLCKALFFFFF